MRLKGTLTFNKNIKDIPYVNLFIQFIGIYLCQVLLKCKDPKLVGTVEYYLSRVGMSKGRSGHL